MAAHAPAPPAVAEMFVMEELSAIRNQLKVRYQSLICHWNRGILFIGAAVCTLSRNHRKRNSFGGKRDFADTEGSRNQEERNCSFQEGNVSPKYDDEIGKEGVVIEEKGSSFIGGGRMRYSVPHLYRGLYTTGSEEKFKGER